MTIHDSFEVEQIDANEIRYHIKSNGIKTNFTDEDISDITECAASMFQDELEWLENIRHKCIEEAILQHQ